MRPLFSLVPSLPRSFTDRLSNRGSIFSRRFPSFKGSSKGASTVSASKDQELIKTRNMIIERLGSVKRPRSLRKSWITSVNEQQEMKETGTEMVDVELKSATKEGKEELSQPSSPRSVMSEEARNRNLWVDEEGKGRTLHSSREHLRDEEAALERRGEVAGGQQRLQGLRKVVKVGHWRRSSRV